MPYQSGQRLPAERASRLGHLDVLKSNLVNDLISAFNNPTPPPTPSIIPWIQIPQGEALLQIVLSTDGSVQNVNSDTKPTKEMAFIKTTLLQLDQTAIATIDPESPHPMAVRDILTDSAIYHATVIPLKNVTIPGTSTYHTVRQTIYESLKDASLDGEPLETLKWLAYEKWDSKHKNLPTFLCPHCEQNVATLPYDAEIGNCPSCNGSLYISDFLGFHQDMSQDVASEIVATSYMNIHETLLLFTGIRHFWENDRSVLERCLFIKDGPLSLRAQYSKLVSPIRRFLSFAQNQRHTVYIIGQEKSGFFFDHLQLIHKDAPIGSIFIPDDAYIQQEVQSRPISKDPYGLYTNYGAKVFVKLNHYHHMVLSIPTGPYIQNPSFSNLIGASRIFSTLPSILSNRFEGALLPVELAHGIASLATYPSVQVFKKFMTRT